MQHVPLPNPHLRSSATYSKDKCSHEICPMLPTEVGYCLATNRRKDHSTIHHHKRHTSQQQLLLYQGNGISWSACRHLQWPSVLDNKVQHYHCSFSIVCVIVQQYTCLFMLIKRNEIIVEYAYATISRVQRLYGNCCVRVRNDLVWWDMMCLRCSFLPSLLPRLQYSFSTLLKGKS